MLEMIYSVTDQDLDALHSKMLDLGLLKIRGGVVIIFSPCGGGYNHMGPYYISFPALLTFN